MRPLRVANSLAEAVLLLALTLLGLVGANHSQFHPFLTLYSTAAREFREAAAVDKRKPLPEYWQRLIISQFEGCCQLLFLVTLGFHRAGVDVLLRELHEVFLALL